MTFVEKLLAPDESRLAFIVPLGHGSGTGGRWRLYLGLSRRLLFLTLFLTLIVDSILLLCVGYVLKGIFYGSVPPMSLDTIFYAGFLLLIGSSIPKALLDGLHLVYFVQTGKYKIRDKSGMIHIRVALKR